MEKVFAAETLKRLGRYAPQQPGCGLGWAMSGVQLCAACTAVSVEIACEYGDQCPWIGVLADGAPVARFALKRGTHWYQVIAGMDRQHEHEIAVVRDTQPDFGDGGTKVDLLRVSVDGELLPVKEKELVIEFVGDSLTSGEGVIGAVRESEWRMAYISAMNSYAQMTACELDAEARWVSLSGWGVHCSWDGVEACRIPALYHQVCGAEPRSCAEYDFSIHPAGLVVINLGTNDAAPMAALRGKARKAYRQTVYQDAKAFLRQVRSCNPGAHILWAYGMCGRPLEKEIRQAVEELRAEGDERMDYLRLPQCRGDEIGSRQHPGPAYHRRASKLIARYLRSILHK